MPELKFHSVDWLEANADLSSGVISNTSSVVLIGQGQTQSTRLGRKLVLRSMQFQGMLTFAAQSGASIQVPQVTRLILVQDTQCNGSAPDVAGDDGVLETGSWHSFFEVANDSRFVILYDEVTVLNPRAAAGDGTTNDTGSGISAFEFSCELDVPIEYSGTADPSVIDEIRTNNIFGIMITDSATGVTSLDSKFRFRFTDG